MTTTTTSTFKRRDRHYLEYLHAMATGLRNAEHLARNPRVSAATRENSRWFADDMRRMLKNDFDYDPDRIFIPELGRRSCPDFGTCHHVCLGACFRVLSCGPLSGIFPNDEWPAEVIHDNRG